MFVVVQLCILKDLAHFTGKHTLEPIRYRGELVNLHVSSDPSSPQVNSITYQEWEAFMASVVNNITLCN